MKNPCFILLFFAAKIFAQEKTEVFFDFNKDFPIETSAMALQKWATENTDAVVTELRGFCDSTDVNTYNKELASRRIGTVLKMLENSGITLADNLQIKPLGEDFELSPDAAKNRRVDIFFKKSKKTTPAKTEEQTVPEDELSPEDRKSIAEKFVNVKKGDIIRIRSINFFLNSEIVVPESEPRLEELLQVMIDHPKLKIEIHGHICCNPNTADTKLSYRRAKFIFTYLLKKGIALNRLGYKGFGSSDPIYKIPERTYQEEAANRRVEILVKEI